MHCTVIISISTHAQWQHQSRGCWKLVESVRQWCVFLCTSFTPCVRPVYFLCTSFTPCLAHWARRESSPEILKNNQEMRFVISPNCGQFSPHVWRINLALCPSVFVMQIWKFTVWLYCVACWLVCPLWSSCKSVARQRKCLFLCVGPVYLLGSRSS